MVTRLQTWGNSLALRIPKRVCEEAGLKYNSRVNVILNKRQIIIEAVFNEALCLNDLLDDITEENLHAEVATGPAVGTERLEHPPLVAFVSHEKRCGDYSIQHGYFYEIHTCWQI